MLGYVLGMIATSVLIEWARESGRESLGEVLFMCSAVFQIAFVFGVVRLLLRGLRWGAGFFVRRSRTAPQNLSEPPGH